MIEQLTCLRLTKKFGFNIKVPVKFDENENPLGVMCKEYGTEQGSTYQRCKLAKGGYCTFNSWKTFSFKEKD